MPGNGNDPDAATDRITFSERDAWKFPPGTVFVQHFDLPTADGKSFRPIETRVLVRHTGEGVYGVSYRWNEAGDDASLVTKPELVTVSAGDSNGIDERKWQFFDRQSCLACHNANAGFILGVNARQLNGGDPHGGQLSELRRANYFRNTLSENQLRQIDALVAPDDADASLAARARSYLDVNCSACHREGGARSNFFAEFHRTADETALATKPMQSDFGIRLAQVVVRGDPFRSVLYYRMAKLGQGRMPFIGAHDLDREGLDLIRDWIETMRPVSKPEHARPQWQDEAIAQLMTNSVASDQTSELIRSLLADTRGAFALWQAVYDDAISTAAQEEAIALALSHESPHVRDLFEWFVDPRQRTSRLGINFDPHVVLQHEGDPVAGRKLYENAELLSCKSCHDTPPGQPLIGPSIRGIGQKLDRAELLLHIMQPSVRIAPEYTIWKVETMRGRAHCGLLVSQSDEEVVLREGAGQEHSIQRNAIDVKSKKPQSLMPENLLQGLTPVEAADLLAYLESLE